MTNSLDDTPLSFGKHKGKTPFEVAAVDPGYIVWMQANVNPPKCSCELAQECISYILDSDDRFFPYDDLD